MNKPERTLVPALLPKGPSNINACFTVIFDDLQILGMALALTLAIPVDFFVKTTGKANFRDELFSQLPFLKETRVITEAVTRACSLVCLTSHYREFWESIWAPRRAISKWCRIDPRLNTNFFENLKPNWSRSCSLRTPFERRQALLEIDVLISMALGLSLEELLSLFRSQFYLVQQYEGETFYDLNGRIIFTINKGLVGVGLPRKANPKKDRPCLLTRADGSTEERPLGWEDVKDLPEGATVTQTVIDDTLPGGPREKKITYHAPFERCDREEDYRIAWAEFSRRFAEKET